MGIFLERKTEERTGIFGQNRPPVQSFTLTFIKPELRKKFGTYSTLRSLAFVRVSLVLAIFLYLFFAALDRFIIEGGSFEIMSIRIASCLLFGAAILLTYTHWGVRHFQFLMSMVVMLAGMGIIGMILVFESSGYNYYYAGLILAVMYAHGLLRIRYIYATLTTWSIILLYITATIALDVTPFEIYMNNLFFLISANIMGMFASYWLEYYMKAVFWQTRLLQQKGEELASEHERKSRELESARRLQLNLLPKSSPCLTNFEFFFFMNPATEIGGDYFDYRFDDDGALSFAVGDATGHGAQAGVLVTAVKMLFTDLASSLDLIGFLKRASRSIHQMGFRKLYMAFAIGKLKGNSIEIAGAGIPPALVYRSQTRTIETIQLKGLPLGTAADYPYKKTAFTLDPGDSVLLMTDGFPELYNRVGKMFGYDRIQSTFQEVAHHTPDKIIEHLTARMNEWLNGLPQNDDITFFAIRRKAVLDPREKDGKAVAAA